MKKFKQKFIGLLMIAFTLFISQSYAQLSLHVNTTTNSVYFSNSFPVSVSVYDFNLVSSTPWSVTTSSGIDFGTYGCNSETFGDGSSAYMCGIHSGYWEPYASGLISLDGQPLYSGSGSAGGIGNNVIYIDYTSSDQANGIPVEGNVYNISGGGQSTSVPSGNRHIAYMAPQTIEYIYAEAHTGGGNMTSIPVYINGQLLEQDCAGTWGGSSVNDACGVCDGDNSSCSGCTSSWASNYDQDATIDDESCELSGCTDQAAINYNQNATDDDGSCIALILGCMDAAAVNYSANANTDNGMCQPYTLADVEEAEEAAYTAGFTDGHADGHADGVIYGSPILIDAIIDLPEGWSMFGYTCINSVDATVGFADLSDKIEIVKDEWGLSYLPAWEFNAMGSLKFSEGYQIKMNSEVDSFYFCQTHTLKTFGCIEETALNYNSSANTDDGSCIAAVTGCMDEDAFNYNPEANTEDNSCIEVINGCIDESALNYDALANTNDGCEYPYTDATISFTGEYYFSPEILWEIRDCNGTVLVNGDGSYQNTIQLPENYIINMSSPYGYGWDDAILNINESSYSLENGSYATEMIGICPGVGCTDEVACNYNVEANILDESCEYPNFGYDCYGECLTDSDNDGICDELEVVGCQDDSFYNYNSEATDSGICIPFIEGCTTTWACNFNPEANTNNESCYINNLGCGCDNPAPIQGLNCQGNTIQIGDVIYGGMVFQINEDGTGLVASLEDIEVLLWNDAMLAASNSTAEGFEDWRLPTLEELELMYNTIGQGADNVGGFSTVEDGNYWSSEIYPDLVLEGMEIISVFRFTTGLSNYYGDAANFVHTRIIREF